MNVSGAASNVKSSTGPGGKKKIQNSQQLMDIMVGQCLVNVSLLIQIFLHFQGLIQDFFGNQVDKDTVFCF